MSMAETSPISSQDSPRLDPDLVRKLALEAGFDDAGSLALPQASEMRDAQRFTQWVETGRAGTMHYLARKAEDGRMLRARVQTPFPWARSAVICFATYNAAQPRSTDPAYPGLAWIARYAWSSRIDAQGVRRPSDYHKILLKRLRGLEAQLHVRYGDFQSRAYVDTGPVVERTLAVAAGLGWAGKNTCLIHPRLGSYGFLAVLVTSLGVKEVAARLSVPDRCGSCRRCLDACPTGALIEPYQMDATLCISYLTIEYKGAIAPDLMGGMGRQIFGCDICQDVCPWNRKAAVSADGELEARTELVNPALEWLAAMDEAAFERTFNGSPVRRAGFVAFRRNLAIAMGNAGIAAFGSQLHTWASSADDGLRSAAQWALSKLRPTQKPPRNK